MKLLREEEGQTLFLTSLCMAALLGFMALALDVGTSFYAKRRMQIAADAAAMAGATENYYNGATNVVAKAKAAAKANGVDSTVAGNMVTVTIPPVTVGGTSCATCVEVQLAVPNSTPFMSIFTGSRTTNVGALAIAGAPGANQTCVYVMNPTASSALWIHGAGAIIAPNCGVYVNSSAGDALCVTGNAGKSNFGEVSVVGGQGSGNCKGDPGPPVSLNSSVQTDPWGSLPDPASSCTAGNTTNLASASLSGTITGPGYGNVSCYSYNPCTTSKKGVVTCTPTTVNLSGATLGPGTYEFLTGVYISGTVKVGNGNSATGTLPSGGATIATTGTGSLNIDTNSNFTIYSPADSNSTYNGVALYQSAADTSAMQISFGSSSATFDGMVYAPGADMTLHDEGGGGLTATGLVVGTIYVNGQVNLTNYSTFNPVTTPFKIITLVQ